MRSDSPSRQITERPSDPVKSEPQSRSVHSRGALRRPAAQRGSAPCTRDTAEWFHVSRRRSSFAAIICCVVLNSQITTEQFCQVQVWLWFTGRSGDIRAVTCASGAVIPHSAFLLWWMNPIMMLCLRLDVGMGWPIIVIRNKAFSANSEQEDNYHSRSASLRGSTLGQTTFLVSFVFSSNLIT